VSFEREIEVARTVARRGGELALRYQNQGVSAETKPDFSPVTVADREAERLIAGLLTEAFPGDGLLGEEGGARGSASGRRWIVDPIDGTREFLRGLPHWAVLLALEDGDGVAAGVCHFPALEATYWAARGEGAWRNGTRIRVSSVTDTAAAGLNITGLFAFPPRLAEWARQFLSVHSYSSCQDTMYVADGHAEVSIQGSGKIWDFAPLRIVAEEAGAVFFNFDGGQSLEAGNGVIATPAFAAEARRVLTPTPE
jgi:fructose-1,6-bisphosphatase/inositol monophosphatase family enzyme